MSVTSTRRTTIVVRTPQDILDAIDEERVRAQARRPGRTASRNAVVVDLLLGD